MRISKKDFRKKISYKAQELLGASSKEELYVLVFLVKKFIEAQPREKLESMMTLSLLINERLRQLTLEDQEALISELDHVFFTEYRGKIFVLAVDFAKAEVIRL